MADMLLLSGPETPTGINEKEGSCESTVTSDMVYILLIIGRAVWQEIILKAPTADREIIRTTRGVLR